MPIKYVMLRLEKGDLLPVISLEFMQHSHVATAIPGAVVSAGRVYLENGQVVVRGTSKSLGVSSREQDSQIIQGYFAEGGIIQREY